MPEPYNPTTRQEDWARSITEEIRERFRADPDELGIDPIKAKIDLQWFYTTVIDKAIEDYRKDRKGFFAGLKNYLTGAKKLS
jgi:hypothetical protein